MSDLPRRVPSKRGERLLFVGYAAMGLIGYVLGRLS